MESWFVIAPLSLALLVAVMLLVHHVRLVRALKRLLRRLITLGRNTNAPTQDPSIHHADTDDTGLRKQ